ncbi:MAG: hypothetical protein JWR15_4632 [Prosthecobacter sp.]|nr:hypothetical protein [Prosthecobacter sp.]
MSLNSVITSAASLQRLDGVAGVMLFKGRNTIHRQMPFSDMRAENLREIINQMLDGYRQVRRSMRQIFLEFDGGSLLIVTQDEVAMLFFLTSRADSDLAASAASVMLNDHAKQLSEASTEFQPVAPLAANAVEELVVTSPRALQQITEKAEVMNNWWALRKHIEGILGKVMGRAQLSMMIDRVLAKRGTPDPYRLSPAETRKLAVELIEQVPNTTKRQALMSELEAVLADHKL